MKTVSDLEILAVTFSNNNNFDKGILKTSQKCRQSVYPPNSSGTHYPVNIIVFDMIIDIANEVNTH